MIYIISYQEKIEVITKYEQMMNNNENGFNDLWLQLSTEHKYSYIREEAFTNNNIIAGRVLLNYTLEEVERLSLHSLFKNDYNYYESYYLFDGKFDSYEIKKIISNMYSEGVQFAYPDVTDNYLYIGVGFEDRFVAWKFHRKFQNNKLYMKSHQFIDENIDEMRLKAIQQNTIVWDYYSIRRLLHTSGFSIYRGSDLYWYLLPALINLKLITVSTKDCPIPNEKIYEFDSDKKYNLLSARMQVKGDKDRGLLAYCVWNWLYDKGDKKIEFPTSICNIKSELFSSCVQIGDAEPDKIIDFIFPYYQEYVLVPLFRNPTLIIFKKTESFGLFLSKNEETILTVDAEINRLISIESERKERLREEQRKMDYYNSQLKNINQNVKLSTGRVLDILKYDDTSPFKGQNIKLDRIRGWIKSGKLVGNKDYSNSWIVNKEDLVDFIDRMKKD